MVVPSTTTFAPIIGSPAASSTVPVTLIGLPLTAVATLDCEVCELCATTELPQSDNSNVVAKNALFIFIKRYLSKLFLTEYIH